MDSIVNTADGYGLSELQARIEEYNSIHQEYLNFFRERGIEFGCTDKHKNEMDAVYARLQDKGALFRNGRASVSIGALSVACEACTGDPGSETFFYSLRCPRNCYFCFNPNQQDYEYYVCHDRDWRCEFDAIQSKNRAMTHIALTGGGNVQFFAHFDSRIASR